MLLQLCLGDLAHLCDRFMQGHDLHILMMRLPMFPYILNRLMHLLLPELRTHPSIIRRLDNLDIEVWLIVAHSIFENI